MQTKQLPKKVLWLLLAAFLLPTAAFAQKILRYSDHQALDGMRTQFLQEVFFPAIEKESKGRLKIDAHWDGALAKAYEALGAVKAGKQADMATTVPEYTAKELPLHQIFKSFPVGPSGEQQLAFFRRVYRDVPAFSTELQKNNVVEIFLGTGYPVAFFSTQPLKSLQDIQGQTWRTASFWHQDFLNNAGAVPVTMPWGDAVYKALQARTMDGLMVNVDSGYDLKVHEHAPYALVSKDLWLGHLYPVVMNRDTWNALEPQDQQAIQRAAQTAYQSLGAVMDRGFDAQIAALRQGGATIRILARQEVQAFQAATRYPQAQAVWASDQESKGLMDARAVLKQVSAILKETLE